MFYPPSSAPGLYAPISSSLLRITHSGPCFLGGLIGVTRGVCNRLACTTQPAADLLSHRFGIGQKTKPGGRATVSAAHGIQQGEGFIYCANHRVAWRGKLTVHSDTLYGLKSQCFGQTDQVSMLDPVSEGKGMPEELWCRIYSSKGCVLADNPLHTIDTESTSLADKERPVYWRPLTPKRHG